MLKSMFAIRVLICALSIIVSNVCYAVTFTKKVTMGCSPTVPKANWMQINAGPNTQYTLTTVGIEVAGEGMVTYWYNDDEAIYHDDTAYVIAQCVPPGGQPINGMTFKGVGKQMYSFMQGEPVPVLVCPKGYAVAIRFLSPNDPDERKYIYRATLTVTRDDEPSRMVTDMAPQPPMGIAVPGNIMDRFHTPTPPIVVGGGFGTSSSSTTSSP